MGNVHHLKKNIVRISLLVFKVFSLKKKKIECLGQKVRDPKEVKETRKRLLDKF